MRISSDYGIVIRQAALREQRVRRTALVAAMEGEPLDESADLVSFGPHFGGEAAEALMRRLEALGLEFYDDFFIFQGDFPFWCSFSGSLVEDQTEG
ncbi:MAG: hypothetical protein R3F43_25600 [bacterium]